jgi:nucleoside-diphosphate-sugar epimerase
MSSESYPVRNIGIYHSLPTFDPSIRGLTAVITGANGISGFAMLRALLDSPERWSKIYAISRRPPAKEMMNLLQPDQRSRVQHVACDFLDSPEDIAQVLKSSSVTADYIFFYSYLQPRPSPGSAPWTNASELVRVNVSLLSNFLDALSLAGIKPRRFCLQTGAKNYGVHLGRVRVPALESDPRVTLEPNFYYPQEDKLWEWCREHKVHWNVIRPSWIIGAVNNAQMTALYPFAIYAAVAAQRRIPLVFPSTWSSWHEEAHHATARLTGYLTEWAVLEDKCKNQAFNAQDTSPLTWDRLWEELVRWFGVENGFVGPRDNEEGMIVVAGRGGKESPVG